MDADDHPRASTSKARGSARCFALTRCEIIAFAQRFDTQPWHLDNALAEARAAASSASATARICAPGPPVSRSSAAVFYVKKMVFTAFALLRRVKSGSTLATNSNARRSHA